MKKLVVAAVVALAAVAVNAATVSWGVTAFTGPNGTSSNTGTAYSDVYTATLAIYTSYEGGNLSGALNLGGEDESYTSYVSKKGKLSAETADVITDTVGGDGTTYYAVLTIEMQDGSATYKSDVTAFNYSKDDTASPTLDFSGPSSASQWTSIPEPTSGLLLLLGVAGLALRRKLA